MSQTVDKLGRFVKGAPPWNKGKTGIYSEETRRKIREARARQAFPPDYAEKMSAALTGRHHTWGHKISAGRKRLYAKQGYLNTPETCAKISAALRASPGFMKMIKSEERREKLLRANTGRVISSETREKTRRALKGVPFTDERRQNWRRAMDARTEEQKTAAIVKMMETQRQRKHGYISQTETELLDRLEEILGASIERQYRIGRKFFDGRWGRVLIEVDGTHWHSSPESAKRDAVKDDIAKANGFLLFRIRIKARYQIDEIIAKHKTEILKLNAVA